MKIKSNITVYEDFLKDYKKINAWTISEIFPLKDIVMNEMYSNYAVIEIAFTGTHGDNDKYERIRVIFESFLTKYILSIKSKNKVLFNIGEKGLKSRIRSYKGLFKENIQKKYYLNEEFDLDDKYSIIGGLMNIDETNIDLMQFYLFDRVRCFLLISDDNIFSEAFLIDCFESVLNKSSFTVNYIKACGKYCNDSNIIIRESGDGGDQEFSWQIFVNKKNVNYIKKDLEKLLKN